MNIVIKNVKIADGTGTQCFMGHIVIKDEKIQEICIDHIKIPEESKVIDGAGLVCAPGFIDTHSHSDLKLLMEPELLPKLMQGITTEVLGQDGISMAPLPLEYISPWRLNLAGLDGDSDEIDWTYENTDGYLQMVEQAKPALNETYLLPHGNVRMEAMGLGSKMAEQSDIKKMCEIVRREMEAGCIGLSSGLIYMPCAYSNTEELIALCKVVKEYEGVFVVHQRSEGDTILPSMDEIIHIGKESGVDIHFSHFKVCGKQNWDKLPLMLEKLDAAKKQGIKVSFDQYPYVAGSTMLGVILPPWAHNGGTGELLKRLASKEEREQMKKDIASGIEGWDNFIDFAGLEGIFITSVAGENNRECVGLNLKELGEKKKKEPLEATFDLLLEEKNAVGMVDFYGLEDHVKTIMKREEMNVCTDGLLAGEPHPRVYGSFPRILGKYVREEKTLSLEEAIYKMTGKAAKSLKIPQRGFIKKGYYADLVIFDEHEIGDRGTFTEPKVFPAGIVYVLVNGTVEVEKGRFTGNRCGKVLRHGE